jgi:uncharacterized membrane protein required for colicin V production
VTLDFIIIGALVLFGFFGYRHGFFKKVFGLVSFILGLVLATKCMGPCGALLERWLDLSPEISFVVGFFSVFLLVILLQKVLYRLLVKKEGSVDLVNRLAGMLIGLAEGLIGISLVLLMVSVFGAPSEKTKRDSSLYKPALNFAPRLFDFALEMIPTSKKFYDILKKDLQHYEIFG